MDGKKYNSKTDIWSLGCILYEMMCLKLPFDGSSMRQLCSNIINATPPKPPSIYSLALQTLAVKEMLAKNPKHRPSANAILAKEFLKDRITEFLEITGHPNELNHTVLHGVNIMTSTHSSNTTSSSVSDKSYPQSHVPAPQPCQVAISITDANANAVEARVQARAPVAAVAAAPRRPVAPAAVVAPAPLQARNNLYAPKPAVAVNNNPYAVKPAVSKPKMPVPTGQLSAAALKAQVDAKVAAIMAKAQQQVQQSYKYKIPSVKASMPAPVPSAYRASNANAAAAIKKPVPRVVAPSSNQEVVAEKAIKPDPRYILDSQYGNNLNAQPPLKARANIHGQVKVTDKHKNLFAFAANLENKRPDWVDLVPAPTAAAAAAVPVVSESSVAVAVNKQNIPSNVLDVWQRWKDNSDALDDKVRQKITNNAPTKQSAVPTLPSDAVNNSNSNNINTIASVMNANANAADGIVSFVAAKPPVSVFAFADGPSARNVNNNIVASRPAVTRSAVGNSVCSTDTRRVVSSYVHQPDLGLNLVGTKLNPTPHPPPQSPAVASSSSSSSSSLLSNSNRIHIMRGTVNRLLTKAKDAIQAHCIKQASAVDNTNTDITTAVVSNTSAISTTNTSDTKQPYLLQQNFSSSAVSKNQKSRCSKDDDNNNSDDDDDDTFEFGISDSSCSSIASSAVPTPTSQSQSKLSAHNIKLQAKLGSKHVSPEQSPKINNNWFLDLAKQMDALKSQVNQLQQETESKSSLSANVETPPLEYEQSGLFQNLIVNPNGTSTPLEANTTMTRTMANTANLFDLNQSKMFANITIQMKVLNARVEVIKQFAAKNSSVTVSGEEEEGDEAIAIDKMTMKVLLDEANFEEECEGVAPAKKHIESKLTDHASSKLCSKENNNKIFMKKSWFNNLSNQMDALKSKVSHIQESQLQPMFSPLAEADENEAEDELIINNNNENKNNNINAQGADVVSTSVIQKQQRKQEREKQQQDFREFIRAKKEGLQKVSYSSYIFYICYHVNIYIVTLNCLPQSPERGSSSSSNSSKPQPQSGRRLSAASSTKLAPSPTPVTKKSVSSNNITSNQSKVKQTSAGAGISPTRRTGPSSGGATRDVNSNVSKKSANSKSGVSSSQSKSKVNNSNSKSVKKVLKKDFDSQQSAAVSASAAGGHKVKTAAEVKAQRDAERIEMKKVIDERRKLLKMKKLISNNNTDEDDDDDDDNDESNEKPCSPIQLKSDVVDVILVPKRSLLEPQSLHSNMLSSSDSSNVSEEENKEDSLLKSHSQHRKLNRDGSTATSIGISLATTLVAGNCSDTNSDRDSDEEESESVEESVAYALSGEAQVSCDLDRDGKTEGENDLVADASSSPLIHFDSPIITAQNGPASGGGVPSYFDFINMSNSKFKQGEEVSEQAVPSPPVLVYGGGVGAADLEYSALFTQLQNVLAMPPSDGHSSHHTHKSPPRISVGVNNRNENTEPKHEIENELVVETQEMDDEGGQNDSSSHDSDAFDEDDEANYHGLKIAAIDNDENDDDLLYPTDLNDELEFEEEESGDLVLESYTEDHESSVNTNGKNAEKIHHEQQPLLLSNQDAVAAVKSRPSIETMEKHFQLNLSPRKRNSDHQDDAEIQIALGQTLRTTPVHSSSSSGQRGEMKSFDFKEGNCHQQQPKQDVIEANHAKEKLGQYLVDALGVEPFAAVIALLAKAYNDDTAAGGCEEEEIETNRGAEEDDEDKLLQDIEKMVGVNGLQYLDDMLLYVTLDS